MSQPRESLAPEEEPIFNIGAVSRMTSIPETTLRAWERRYDFPQAARTGGGHRLYSEQEVARLQWVKSRLDAGMQISQAIRVLRHSQRDGQDNPLAEPPELAPAESEGAQTFDLIRCRLLEALLAHDSLTADQVIAEAYTLFSLESLILKIIGPVLSDIGEAWHSGAADVASEHFASNYLRYRLFQWMDVAPPAYRVKPVVLACAPGELHEGSLLMLAVLLRRLRWPVIYLGQTVPLAELARFLESVDAAVVVFVAMTEETAHALVGWPQWLNDAAKTNRPIVSYGGRGFVENLHLSEQVPGVLLGETLQEGVTTLNRMLHKMNPLLY